MECNKDEAIRAMDIAKRKVTENDYTGAKAFAIKAQNLYPQLDGLKQVLMLIDVYISAGNKITGGESDWYGVLGVDPLADEGVVKRQYRKLALLLHPDKNKCEGAEGAFKLVLEAWSLLSDKVKRIAFDQKRNLKEVKPRKSRKEKQPPKEQKQPAKQPKPPKQPKQPKQPKPPKEPKPPKQPKPPKEPKPPMQPQQPPMQPQQPENQQPKPPKEPKPPMQPQQPENQQKQPPMQPQQPENQQKQPPKQPKQPPMQPQQPENQHNKQPPKQPRQPPMQPQQPPNQKQQPPQQPQNQQRQPLSPQKQPQNQQKQAPSPQKQPQNQQKQAPSPHKQPPNQPSSDGSRNGRARSKKPTPKVSTFWTMCNKCGTQHEYVRVYYLNKTVLCRNCLVSFKATEKEKTPQETNENTRVASCGKDSLSRMASSNSGNVANQPEERVKRVVELDEKDDEAARGIANSDYRRLKKLRTDGGAKASNAIKV